MMRKKGGPQAAFDVSKSERSASPTLREAKTGQTDNEQGKASGFRYYRQSFKTRQPGSSSIQRHISNMSGRPGSRTDLIDLAEVVKPPQDS